MNHKLIQELIDQSTKTMTGYCERLGNYKLPDFNRYKFAELIVKECINVCNNRVGNSDYNTGRMHCANDIKEHFKLDQ